MQSLNQGDCFFCFVFFPESSSLFVKLRQEGETLAVFFFSLQKKEKQTWAPGQLVWEHTCSLACSSKFLSLSSSSSSLIVPEAAVWHTFHFTFQFRRYQSTQSVWICLFANGEVLILVNKDLAPFNPQSRSKGEVKILNPNATPPNFWNSWIMVDNEEAISSSSLVLWYNCCCLLLNVVCCGGI